MPAVPEKRKKATKRKEDIERIRKSNEAIGPGLTAILS